MKDLLYLFIFSLILILSCKKDKNMPQVVYQDSLTTNDNTWPVGNTNIDTQQFAQGHYDISVVSANNIVWSLAPYSTINFPYTAQVTGTTILDDTSLKGNVALVFNWTDNIDFAVAEIWTNGSFRIWLRVNGNTSTLVDFTFNSAINTGSGSTNTIKVIQGQSSVQLLVNNVSMGNFNLSLPAGLIQTGPAVATAVSQYTPETGEFNNFSISKNN